jgi:phosphatidylglycerophosphate synthase
MEHVVASIGAACLAGLFVLYLGRRKPACTTQPRSHGQILPAIIFDFGDWLLASALPVFRYLCISPNLLSLLSLPACACAAGLIATGHFGLGGVVMALAFSLDAWDGALARTLGVASDAGEMVDALIDRYNDVIVMLGFLFYFRTELLSWLLAGAALVGSVTVSYIRAKGASLGVDTNVGFMQRHERAVWLIERPSRHPAYYAVVVALAAVAIGTNITAIRRARLVVATLVSRERQRVNCLRIEPDSRIG